MTMDDVFVLVLAVGCIVSFALGFVAGQQR